MIIIEILTFLVLTWTLIIVQRYTKATEILTDKTAELYELELERRTVERDDKKRDYDLNLLFVRAYHNDSRSLTTCLFDNKGGPVTDTSCDPGGDIEVVNFDREERWYPDHGSVTFRYTGEENIGPRKFQFTARYTNKYGQRRTKSFTVVIESKNLGEVREIETVDGDVRDHLNNLGTYLAPHEQFLAPEQAS